MKDLTQSYLPEMSTYLTYFWFPNYLVHIYCTHVECVLRHSEDVSAPGFCPHQSCLTLPKHGFCILDLTLTIPWWVQACVCMRSLKVQMWDTVVVSVLPRAVVSLQQLFKLLSSDGHHFLQDHRTHASLPPSFL